MVKLLDTSVIFRLYDSKAPENLKKEILRILSEEEVFVPCEVVVELAYLLRKGLKMSKGEVIEEIENLFLRKNVSLEEVCKEALALWKNSSLDKLVDAIILVKAMNKKAVLVTMDEAMKKEYERM